MREMMYEVLGKVEKRVCRFSSRLDQIEAKEYRKVRTPLEEMRYWLFVYSGVVLLFTMFLFVFVTAQLGFFFSELSLSRCIVLVLATAALVTFVLWDVVSLSERARKPGLKPLSGKERLLYNIALFVCMGVILSLIYFCWMSPEFFTKTT